MAAKWRIAYEPRQRGDKRPWLLTCPAEVDESGYELTMKCNCRRFKNGITAIRFFNRRVKYDHPA